LDQWLPDWLTGITRREHLGRLPLAEALRSRLTPIQLRALESLAPRELAMPSGSQVRVDYLDDNAPCVAVRMQEVFGLAATPRIGGGTAPVTLVLLSPARRPLQITAIWRDSGQQLCRRAQGDEGPLSEARLARKPARAARRVGPAPQTAKVVTAD